VTTLFFLHGVGGGRAAWDRQVPYFSGRGYRCVAWDQPGYGGTAPVEPYTFEKVAEALARQIDEPAVLVGHSMGGMVAQETYARYPDRVTALVLTFTSPAFPAAGGDFAREFVAARTGPLDQGRSMAEIAAALMPTMRGAKSDSEGLALAQRIMAAVPPETYRKAVQLLTTFDRREHLPKTRVPTLLVAGSDDRVAPPAVLEKMSKRIPGARYVLLEGCGHLGPMDRPDAFNAVLENFLEKR
jgi:pimeloyl-ACP methyl ester carboxylesterase